MVMIHFEVQFLVLLKNPETSLEMIKKLKSLDTTHQKNEERCGKWMEF